MKVKIFETSTSKWTAKDIQESINEWLENEKPTIIQVLQSDTRGPRPSGGISNYYLTITFLHE